MAGLDTTEKHQLGVTFEFNKYKCTTILFNGFNRKFYTSKSIRLNNICDLEEVFISCLK